MSKLKALGVSAKKNKRLYKFDKPNFRMLEWFANPGKPGEVDKVSVVVKNFTSLCPITSQPDSGHLVVEYEPNERMLESKSFKLYLGGYRNYGAFAETVAVMVKRDLEKVLKPKWMTVRTIFEFRGDIAFGACATYYEPQKL